MKCYLKLESNMMNKMGKLRRKEVLSMDISKIKCWKSAKKCKPRLKWINELQPKQRTQESPDPHLKSFHLK